MELTEEQFRRYARHLILDEVGEEGQEKLLPSRVLVVGAGGLGSPMLLYLAAAGVGTIGIVDDDRVDLTNLQRQIVHATEQRRRAQGRERRAPPWPRSTTGSAIETHPVRLDADNAAELIGGYDLVADGSDNFATRYLLTDLCFRLAEAAGRRGAVAVRGAAVDVPALSRRRRTPATAACSASRRRPTWCRAARRPAYSARSPA